MTTTMPFEDFGAERRAKFYGREVSRRVENYNVGKEARELTFRSLEIFKPHVEPALSSNIAIASREFGDSYPLKVQQWRRRLLGFVLVLSEIFYVSWMLMSLNKRFLWVAIPFGLAGLFSFFHMTLSVVNNWTRSVPSPKSIAEGMEPYVAVIIPTCGEGIPMILRTVTSIFEQDWPSDCLTVVVSDDGHDSDLCEALKELPVYYHSPPDRFSPGRDGAAKAGNLNSALAMIDREFPRCSYIETRDADDEVGTNTFLRQVIGQLESNDRLAYVQTIKETQVSSRDPFENRAQIFYRSQMLAKNATNSVFPCGSGVVWRRKALEDIGNFPIWNLVEDLQSGVEALKRGWSSLYVPIVGAVGQHSPEDLPNVYKQRGTWAIDTVRLMVWGGFSGLGARQRLQFLGMMMDYVNAFTAFIYIPCTILCFYGRQPFSSATSQYVEHFVPLMVATEFWMLHINSPFNDRRGRQRSPIRDLWRFRVVWAGLTPMYALASVRAIAGGKNRKPIYRVTRKYNDLRWHWKEILPQLSIVILVITSISVAFAIGHVPKLDVLIGPLYFGGLYVVLTSLFIPRSWYGTKLRAEQRAKELGA